MTPHPATVLEAWQGPPVGATGPLVLPDGCRDLIARVPANGVTHWYVSDLFDVALEVPAAVGDRFLGWRLHPASVIDIAGLLTRVRTSATLDGGDIAAMLADHVRLDPRLSAALGGLAQARSVRDAAGDLGISTRTLERLTLGGTGRPPAYWKTLARVRRAASDLDGRTALVDVAAAHGFADQAHMTREFRAWFAVSPGAFRGRSDLLAQVRSPGYR